MDAGEECIHISYLMCIVLSHIIPYSNNTFALLCLTCGNPILTKFTPWHILIIVHDDVKITIIIHHDLNFESIDRRLICKIGG